MSDKASETNNYSQPNPSIRTKPNKTVWMSILGKFLIIIIVGLLSYMILYSVLDNISGTIRLLSEITIAVVWLAIFVFGVIVRTQIWHDILAGNGISKPKSFGSILIGISLLIIALILFIN